MLKISRIVLPLLVAAILIGALVARSGLSWSEFVLALRQISPAAAVAILGCTALFLFLSAFKWRLVMTHVSPAAAAGPSWGLSLYYTSLGAVLSLVVTPHAAMVVSRSIGTRLHSKGSAVIGGAASAYEQLFDVIPLLAMSLAAFVALLFRVNFGEWFVLAVLLNAVAFLVLALTFRARFWRAAELLPLGARQRTDLRERLEWFGSAEAKTLLGPKFIGALFAISLVRYAILLLRTGIVMASVGLSLNAFGFLKAYGVARLSTLLSITPGELGVSEWTWSGVLTWMGFRLDDAAGFVLVNRFYNVASLIAIFVIIWLASAGMKLGKRHQSDERLGIVDPNATSAVHPIPGSLRRKFR